MQYELRLAHTESGTGYFSAWPVDGMALGEMFDYFRVHPNDWFMRKHLLKIIGTFDEKRVKSLIETTRTDDPVLSGLLQEACQTYGKFRDLHGRFSPLEYSPCVPNTPDFKKDQALHSQWIQLFRNNIENHHPLPAPLESELAEIIKNGDFSTLPQNWVHLSEIYQKKAASLPQSPIPGPSPRETARRAFDVLQKISIFAAIEMRHVASLSPCALIWQWRLNLSVKNGRHDYCLSGIQNSYGKGLTLDAARVSCLMEIVERCSSFANFSPEGVVGRVKSYPLLHAAYREILDSGTDVLDLSRLCPEADHLNAPLYWLEGERQTGGGINPIMVPAQCIFLFCNLDEVSLDSGLGSTGLASGNTLAGAKVSALLEVIERDSEGVTPYNPEKCFTLASTTPEISVLLEDYRAGGIEIQFQDLTSSLGVPCYKCFVIGPNGEIIKGTAAHLDGKRAVLSALTETPFPYPFGPSSGSGLSGLPTVYLEELPDYATGNLELDLEILETLLIANRYHPVYVDLTRADLGIPVVKALIPGMEGIVDIDSVSRVSPRLFRNYLKLFA